MCFIELENPFGKIEGVIFAKAMETCAAHCQEDTLVTATGTISFRDRRGGGQSETAKLLVDKLDPLVVSEKLEKENKKSHTYTIVLPVTTTSMQLNTLKNILSAFPGTYPVQLELTTPLHKSTLIHLPDHIDPTANFEKALQEFYASIQTK
jgi:DNA polymerase III alpha subunit